jgi:hypothetical protein
MVTISRWLPNEWDRIAVGRQPGYEFGNRQWTYGKARKRAKAPLGAGPIFNGLG